MCQALNFLRKHRLDIINGKGMGNRTERTKASKTNNRPSGMTLLGKWEGGKEVVFTEDNITTTAVGKLAASTMRKNVNLWGCRKEGRRRPSFGIYFSPSSY